MNQQQMETFISAARTGIICGLNHRYEWYVNADRALIHSHSYEEVAAASARLTDAFVAFERGCASGPDEEAEFALLGPEQFIKKVNEFYNHPPGEVLFGIPPEVANTLRRLGNSDPTAGLIALVNSYDAAMESALESGPEVEPPPTPDNVSPLNLGEVERLAADGLVNWDYLISNGNPFVLELELGPPLPMPEYDKRKQAIRAVLSHTPEKNWGSIETRNEIEGRY